MICFINELYIHINIYYILSIETVEEELTLWSLNNDAPEIIIDNEEDDTRKKFLYCLSERSKLWKNRTGPQFTIPQIHEALLYIAAGQCKWISEGQRCLHLHFGHENDQHISLDNKATSRDYYKPNDVIGDNHSNFNDIQYKYIKEDQKWLEDIFSYYLLLIIINYII